jgi:hypothetical protein
VNTSPLDDLLIRVARLEDIEQIRRLKHRYCSLCDQGYKAEEIAAIFTPDGVWEASEPYGRIVGRDAMVRFFRSMPSSVSFSVHSVCNSIIDVDGDVAHGSWRSVIPATFTIDGRAVPHWLFSSYDDTLRKVDGHWLFTHMRSVIQKVSEHRLGWQ